MSSELSIDSIPTIEKGASTGIPIVLLPGIITHRKGIRESGMSPKDYALQKGLFIKFDKEEGILSLLDNNIPVTMIHQEIKNQGIDPIRGASAVWFAGRGFNGISKLAGSEADKYYLKIDENGPKFEVGFLSNPSSSDLVIPEVLHIHDKCDEMFFVVKGSVSFAVDYDKTENKLTRVININENESWIAKSGNEHLLLKLTPQTSVIIVKVPKGLSVENPDPDWAQRREHFSKIKNY